MYVDWSIACMLGDLPSRSCQCSSIGAGDVLGIACMVCGAGSGYPMG